MKAVVIDRFVRDFDEIHVSSVPMPVPKDDEILVKVIAAGVNFVDTLYARGLHQNNRRHIKPPFTLGLEFAGRIISSPSACPFNPGDRVFGSFAGCYASYILISAPSASSVLHHIPPTITYTAAAGWAATLPVSYGALSLGGGLKPNETVLVHSAAGGLGLAAVQIAVALGCRVIGTAGSDEKCKVVEGFGAEACINYSKTESWWKVVSTFTRGRGVNVVFDSVGLVGDSLRCLADRGRILVVGFAGREDAEGKDRGKGDKKEGMEAVMMNRVLLKQASLIGYRFGETHRRNPAETIRAWKELRPLIDSGKIKPTIYDQSYAGLESVPRALQDIASRRVWGKAIIQVAPTEDERDTAKL